MVVAGTVVLVVLVVVGLVVVVLGSGSVVDVVAALVAGERWSTSPA